LRAFDYIHPEDLLAAALEADADALIVALDSITDPRNLGAVVRSAAAFGAQGVLIPERRSAGMTAAAWKTSAGAAARIPIARATNLHRSLRSYADAGFVLVGLDAAGDTSISALPDAAGPMILVIGSEGAGLSRLIREACDTLTSIPISGAVESLNAGVAAGIALYEIGKRRAAQRG
jgi:23S rRNA (guanosine2251-2'-O)-methyltransferase